MAVAAGMTTCVPPFAERAQLLPSEPVTVTAVAFAADTVKVEEDPAVMEAGFAVMVTVGAGGGVATTLTVAVAVAVPPAPLAVAV